MLSDSDDRPPVVAVVPLEPVIVVATVAPDEWPRSVDADVALFL